MSEQEQGRDVPSYDAIVVGAGICGIIFLKYACDRGLRCLVLEKQDDVGGLWNRLPAWQDIQNRRVDLALDGIPLRGVKQRDMHEYVREWVRRFDLQRHIRLECEVKSASWTGDHWDVQTSQGAFHARYLIAASGVQNEPNIPDVERVDSDVVEAHSSELQRPEDLEGRRVTVVGGGTSSFDLLEQALEHGASEIRWVYRSLRWFQPTRRAKQNLWPNLRELAVLQSLLSPKQLNAFFNLRYRTLYRKFGLTDLKPAGAFDLGKHQAVPGRRRMLLHLDAITRHRSEVRRLRGHQVTLANDDRFETDTILWGTGYRMDLAYLGLPEYGDVDRVKKLRPRLGSLVRSNDYPNLFFVGMTLLMGTGSTPLFAAVEARSIVSHMLGECEIPEKNIPDMIIHWALFSHFASFDHANYPRAWWRIKYFFLALWYQVMHDRGFRV